MNGRRGLFLLETILSAFMLLIASGVFVALLHTMMRHSTRARLQTLASLAAEKRLEEIRAWAGGAGTAFYDANQWSPVIPGPVQDPAYPGVELHSEVRDLELLDPSTSMDESTTRKKLAKAVKEVEVTARWGPASGQALLLVSRLAAPRIAPRLTNPLVVRPVGTLPNPLNHNQFCQFEAQAYDQSGRPIPDLCYAWFVLPVTGTGTVASDPMGSTGNLTHSVRLSDGSWTSMTGLDSLGNRRRCRIRVRALYWGEELWGESDDVTLAP